MSPPDTNTEKNKPAHKTPIAGMIGVVIFAVILLVALITWLSYAGNAPDEAGGVEDGYSVEVDPEVEAEVEGPIEGALDDNPGARDVVDE